MHIFETLTEDRISYGVMFLFSNVTTVKIKRKELDFVASHSLALSGLREL